MTCRQAGLGRFMGLTRKDIENISEVVVDF
jgi:hypothetical protein